MRITAEDKLMYEVMKAIYEDGILIFSQRCLRLTATAFCKR